MAVRYVRVQSASNLFAPATRGTGNIAIIGSAQTGTDNVPAVTWDWTGETPSTGTCTLFAQTDDPRSWCALQT